MASLRPFCWIKAIHEEIVREYIENIYSAARWAECGLQGRRRSDKAKLFQSRCVDNNDLRLQESDLTTSQRTAKAIHLIEGWLPDTLQMTEFVAEELNQTLANLWREFEAAGRP